MTNPAQVSPMAAPPDAPGQERGPQVDYTQEIRFAVVMYGGVSLAIYINGVAQELLKLVRATARLRGTDQALPDCELTDTEHVYRKLGKILARGKAPLSLKRLAEQELNPNHELPLQTRFVVDILSGSSAGGINSMALAKALANDQPLHQLKQMWIEEGDFGRLINDRNSLEGTNLAPQVPPRSLLNSQRMYLKLYDAFEDMDATKQQARLDLADELDLYVTATDIEGLPVNLTLADKVVAELRHRNVFHFGYKAEKFEDAKRNDFVPKNTPFLAFAARCTSAFPGAFEPMRLNNIEDVLRRHPRDGQAQFVADYSSWEDFYCDYLYDADGKPTPEAIFRHSFNDGGTLDNKPFSYTIDTLPTRSAEYPVDRKLLYIEPSPEDIILEDADAPPPNLITNVWNSLSTLPRAEAIREDLQRVLARNHLIERVHRIIGGAEQDALARKKAWEPDPTGDEWDRIAFDEMVEKKGLAWGSYQRLRVSELTDELARLVIQMAGYDTSSTESEAIRHLVSQWRQRHYAANPQSAGGAGQTAGETNQKETELRFLRRYDILYRLRRLKYMFTRINELSSLTLEDLKNPESPQYQQWHIVQRIVADQLEDSSAPALDTDLVAFKAELLQLKRNLSEIYGKLLRLHQKLWQPAGPGSELKAKLDALGIKGQDLCDLVSPQLNRDGGMLGWLPAALEASTKQFYDKHATEFDAVAALIGEKLWKLLKDSGDECRELFDTADPIDLPAAYEALKPGAKLARQVIGHYFNHFSDYDMIIYPTVYATEVGELDTIEVFRISPRDAKQLVEEKPGQEPKLAGTLFSNFGAFARQVFRVNDLVWGQLDGAERIITALLPNDSDEPLRTQLIAEAHCEIIQQEFIARDIGYLEQQRIRGLLQKALNDSAGNQSQQKLLGEIQRRLDVLQAARGPDCLDNDNGPYRWEESPLAYFKRTHQKTDRTLEAAETMRAAARASRVVGQMLQDIANEQRSLRSPLVWVTRLTQLFWGLVEVALPDSLQYLIFRHWIKLLYFFELLMVLLGTLLVNPAVQQLGFVAFVVTVTVHAAVLLLQDVLYPTSPPRLQETLNRVPAQQPQDPPRANAPAPAAAPRPVPAKPFKANRWYALVIVLVALLPLEVLGSAVLGATFGANGFRQFIDMLVRPTEGPDPAKIFLVGGIFVLPMVIVFISALWIYQEPWLPEAPPREQKTVLIAHWLPLVAGVIVLLPALWSLVWSPAKPGLGEFRSPALALELASGEQQLHSVVAAYPQQAIGTALVLDSLVFIPVYCLLFICIGIVFVRLSKIVPTSWYTFAIGIFLIICVVAGAVADYLENYYSWQAISVQSGQIADAILLAALVKWWLFVTIAALLAAAFLFFGGKHQIVAILYLIAAAVGAAGLLQYYPLVEWFFALLGLALIPTGAAIWSVLKAKCAALTPAAKPRA